MSGGARWRWQDAAVALLLALATFAHALIYAQHTPTGVPPDEWAHLTHVDEIASGGHWLPDYADSRIIGSGKGNYLGHPPLYYSTLGLAGRVAGWDPSRDVIRYRALSAALVALGLLLWVLVARELGLRWRWTIPICLSVNAIPMFPYLAGSVNNDTMAYLAVALAILGVVTLPRLPRAACYLGAAGMLAALLTKATAAVFLLAFFLVWFLATWHSRPDVLRNRHLLIALGIMMGLGGAYYLYSLAQYGALFPRVGEAHMRITTPAEPLTLWSLIGGSVQQMVTRLPAITSHASTVAVTGPLKTAFLFSLALPLGAWAWTRVSSGRSAANTLGDAFIIALAITMLVHLAMVWRGYAAYGVLAGLQPRYYSYVLPGLFVVCFARADHARVSRMLLATSAALWLGLLLLIPPRALEAEIARHAMQPTITRLSLETTVSMHGDMPLALQARSAGHIDAVELNGAVVHVRGWAVDASTLEPAKAVIVYYLGREIGSAATGFSRPDVAQALDAAYAAGSGFRIELSGAPARFDPCDLVLTAGQVGARPIRLRHTRCDGGG